MEEARHQVGFSHKRSKNSQAKNAPHHYACPLRGQARVSADVRPGTECMIQEEFDDRANYAV